MVNRLKGKFENKTRYKRLFLLLFCMTMFMEKTSAEWQINLTEGVTPVSRYIYDLHMTILGICTLIGIAVYGIMVYIIIRYRHNKGVKAAQFDSNRKVEWLWAVIPLLILIIMAVPATQLMHSMEDFADSEVTIKVTGSQWHWQYQYLDQGFGFFSNLSTPFNQYSGTAKKNQHYLLEVDNRLVVPINRKIRFLITSNDVIHSWWVPALGIKRDAIPGFIHEAWAKIEKTGIYRGQCAELCGVNHGYMPIVVEAVSEVDYEKWQQTQKQQADRARIDQSEIQWSMALAMEQGEQDYKQFCSACHKVDGSGIPPMFPSLVESSVTVGTPISRHIDVVLNGRKGSAMQAYADQLNNRQLAAIITYERNAWGHNTGDLITPGQIQGHRVDSKGKGL